MSKGLLLAGEKGGKFLIMNFYRAEKKRYFMEVL